MKKASIVYNEGIADYDFGPDYDLKGDRFPRYLKLLDSMGVFKRSGIELVDTEPAGDADLLLVHSEEYIRRVERIAEEHGYLADDTPLKPSTVRAVRLIVGAALAAGDLIAGGKVEMAQGVGGGLHHAGRDYGDGWCVFNDVAVCAEALIERHGFERVLIFDTDAHAGNGTMDIFYEEPRVLFLSVHQDPKTLFPYTGFVEQIGRGRGTGYTVNVPLPPGADDACMAMVIDRVFRPLVDQFRPQVIIRNGGADPHHLDDLAGLGLTFEGLRMIGGAVAEAASRAGCGLVDLLCSGYNPGVEEIGLYAILSGELGLEFPFKDEVAPASGEGLIDETGRVIREVGAALRGYWSLG